MLTNFDKMCADLEKQELESLTGIASPVTYAQLLAIYLYQNDLCNAKFLWKRIPQNIISSNPDISAIWAVGQKLWKKDLAGSYQALAAYNWVEPVALIVRALEVLLRPRKCWRDKLVTFDRGWWESAKDRYGWKTLGETFDKQWDNIEKIRERTLKMIGNSYSNISIDSVVTMTGLSKEACLQVFRDRKWTISEDNLSVNPTPPVVPAPLHTSSEDQLFKLTEFVTFLEN